MLGFLEFFLFFFFGGTFSFGTHGRGRHLCLSMLFCPDWKVAVPQGSKGEENELPDSDIWLMIGFFNTRKWYHMMLYDLYVYEIMYIHIHVHMILMIRIRCIPNLGRKTSSGFLLTTFPRAFEGPLFWDILASLFCIWTLMKNGTTIRERDQEGLMNHCDYTIYTIMWNTASNLTFRSHCSPFWL